MLPVRFRPHSISLLTVVPGSYNEETGDYTQGAKQWSEQYPCRYEPNGQARTVPVGVGKDIVYDYIVYMNTDIPEISYGQTLKLYNAYGECFGLYEAKGFHRGQLNAKTWVCLIHSNENDNGTE